MPTQHAPVMVVEFDRDDILLLKQCAEDIGLERSLEFLGSGQALLERLRKAEMAPLLILCEVNMPGQTGFDIRDSLLTDAQLRHKATPFIFWSTAASTQQIQQAYDLSAQGFFVKPTNYTELCDLMRDVVSYWERSKHPKRVV